MNEFKNVVTGARDELNFILSKQLNLPGGGLLLGSDVPLTDKRNFGRSLFPLGVDANVLILLFSGDGVIIFQHSLLQVAPSK